MYVYGKTGVTLRWNLRSLYLRWGKDGIYGPDVQCQVFRFGLGKRMDKREVGSLHLSLIISGIKCLRL